MRCWFSVSLLAIVVGCGSRSVGYLADGEGDTQDGGNGGQAGGGGGGGGGNDATAFGRVGLVHFLDDGPYVQESLSLAGAFYLEDYDSEEQQWGHIETLQTPDGVTCDIYYTSAMGGGGGPPDPPAQIDGGRITAGAGFDADERLEIVFIGDQYGVDWRAPDSPDHPWPSWASSGAVAVSFEGQGSNSVGAFTDEAILPAMPTIVSPPADQQPVLPGPDGNFVISWQPSDADETLVVFQFNLDWDDSTFRCHPAPGVTQLRLPATWISEWTWGSGSMQVMSRNEVVSAAGSAVVSLRAHRIRQRSVFFDAF